MSDSPLTPLDYAGTSTRPVLLPARRTPLYRVALPCWLFPLLAGLAIFAAAEVVRATAPPHTTFLPTHGGKLAIRSFSILVNLGLLDILAGTVLAAVGGAVVLGFAVSRWSAAADDRRQQVIWPSVGLLALLASNFVVALLIVRCASR